MKPKKNHPWKKPFQDQVVKDQIKDDVDHDWLVTDDAECIFVGETDEEVVEHYQNIVYGIYEEEKDDD